MGKTEMIRGTVETNENHTVIRSVNLHVTGRCNYTCEHCFCKKISKNLENECSLGEWANILGELKERGIKKVNLAGGEPMLYQDIDALCRLIKEMDFILSMVTNGSRVTPEWLEKMSNALDWIGFSVDSPDEADEREIGRCDKKKPHIENLIRVAGAAHKAGIKVKLNITVVRRSQDKDFHSLIQDVAPDRIKVLCATVLKGENEDNADTWSVTPEKFEAFKKRHEDCNHIVFESPEVIESSYLMFDHRGKLIVHQDGQ